MNASIKSLRQHVAHLKENCSFISEALSDACQQNTQAHNEFAVASRNLGIVEISQEDFEKLLTKSLKYQQKKEFFEIAYKSEKQRLNAAENLLSKVIDKNQDNNNYLTSQKVM